MLKMLFLTTTAVALAAKAAPAQEPMRHFALSGFDRVEQAGADHVKIVAGETFEVVATGDPRAVAALRVALRGSTLRVDRRSGPGNSRGATIIVTMPMLHAVSVSSSGGVTVDRIDAPTFRGAVSGSSSVDGSRPGIYWLNMRDMGEVPLFTAVMTSFHEGVPGHHLQISLQGGSSIPDVRKLLFPNAYIEGWAHYAEQLADEMGALNAEPAWQLGYVHEALLCSGRLVVDTGIHARRWTREQAVAALHEITGDPVALCGQEVERYACSTGQACGYTIGKVAILRLREKARRALGDRFDIRGFHDAVLMGGAMPLSVL